MPPPEVFLTHRQLVEECRSQSNLVERRDGGYRTADQWKDPHQVAQWLTDVILTEFQMLLSGSAPEQALAPIKWRFAWPSSVAAIALVPPKILETDPAPPQPVAAIMDFLDERAGAEYGITVVFATSIEVRNLLRRRTRPRVYGGVWAEVTGRELRLHPFPAPTRNYMLEYIPWPEAVDPERDDVYRALPIGVLRACVSKAAGQLAAVRRDPTALGGIARERMEAARDAADRLERTGPRFINWSRARGGSY